MRNRSYAAVLVALVLAFSVLMVQGQDANYPVVVSTPDGTVWVTSHSSSLTDGNWIHLSGGTPISIPMLSIAYEGPDSVTYPGSEGSVTISSLFTSGSANYPLYLHQVYSPSQHITATFFGTPSLALTDVDFTLIKISSIAEARDIAVDAYNGDLDSLRAKLNGPSWNALVNSETGDASVTIPSQSVGSYLLLVVKVADPNIFVYSATIVEVVEQTLIVSCPSSVDKGDNLNINTGEGGISAAILIKKSAYTAEVKLVSDSTVLSTAIHLNGALLATGSLVTETLSINTALDLLADIETAIGSDQMAIGANPWGGSMSLPTYSLDTGEYVLLAGVVKLDPIRLVGVYEQTVTVRPSYSPSPWNRPPVADAGDDQTGLVDRTMYFNGTGSDDPDGYIQSWTWDFGDGNTDLGEVVSHTYLEPGNYTVTLTVRDNRYKDVSDTCTVNIVELPEPAVDELEELVPGGETGYIVDALEETNTTVTLNTTAPVTVTIIKYETNPHPDDPLPAAALPVYADIIISDPEAVSWPIYVEMHYTDDDIEGLDESTLGIYYWMDDAWQRCSHTGVDMDRNVVWAYMTELEASGSPILIAGLHEIAPPPLPPFIDNLVITPGEVEIGEDVTISFDIMNPNDQSISYYVTILCEGISLLVDVELEPYETKTMSRTRTPLAEGTYEVTVDGLTGSFTVNPIPLKPAEFVVSDLVVSPFEVEEGEVVTVSVKVTNIGEIEGSYTVDFKVNGETIETDTVTIPGETSVISSFGVSWIAGTYQVSVENLTGEFTVIEEEEVPLLIIGSMIVLIALCAIIYLHYRRNNRIPPIID